MGTRTKSTLKSRLRLIAEQAEVEGATLITTKIYAELEGDTHMITKINAAVEGGYPYNNENSRGSRGGGPNKKRGLDYEK